MHPDTEKWSKIPVKKFAEKCNNIVLIAEKNEAAYVGNKRKEQCDKRAVYGNLLLIPLLGAVVYFFCSFFVLVFTGMMDKSVHVVLA